LWVLTFVTDGDDECKMSSPYYEGQGAMKLTVAVRRNVTKLSEINLMEQRRH